MSLINPLESPLIIAHGGSKKLFPENTMTAFDGSIELGVNALEIDVRLTKDNALVAHHDMTIDRTSNGCGLVINYTYPELSTFNFGYHFKDLNGDFPYKNQPIKIPKLIDIMRKYSDYLMIIEIKDKGESGKKACELLKKYIDSFKTPLSIIVSSFDFNIIQYFRNITQGKIMTGASTKEVLKDYFAHLFHLSNFISCTPYEVLQIPTKIKCLNLAKKKYIQSLHQRNIAVQFWTINNKEEMKKLIALKADGIITDRPDLLKEVLEEIGIKIKSQV